MVVFCQDYCWSDLATPPGARIVSQRKGYIYMISPHGSSLWRVGARIWNKGPPDTDHRRRKFVGGGPRGGRRILCSMKRCRCRCRCRCRVCSVPVPTNKLTKHSSAFYLFAIEAQVTPTQEHRSCSRVVGWQTSAPQRACLVFLKAV